MRETLASWERWSLGDVWKRRVVTEVDAREAMEVRKKCKNGMWKRNWSGLIYKGCGIAKGETYKRTTAFGLNIGRSKPCIFVLIHTCFSSLYQHKDKYTPDFNT